MSTEPSYLKQLIDEFGADKTDADRVLKQFSSNENDPFFWYLLQMKRASNPVAQEMRGLPTAITKEVKKELGSYLFEAKELKREIGGSGAFKNIIFSKILGGLIYAALVVLGVYVFNYTHLSEIKKDDDTTLAVKSLATILKLPDIVLVPRQVEPSTSAESQRRGLSLIVPTGSFQVKIMDGNNTAIVFNTPAGFSQEDDSPDALQKVQIDKAINSIGKADP